MHIMSEDLGESNQPAPGSGSGSEEGSQKPGQIIRSRSASPMPTTKSEGVWVGPPMEDELVVEKDPWGRFYRYKERVGKGWFKNVYKGYDTENGIDVAWCKVSGEDAHIANNQLDEIFDEMCKGLLLDHPNIIKCYKCWEDPDSNSINLITELFTSGTLRQYRQQYKQLDLNALRKYGRQILNGLSYLHNLEPPVVHGDLRLDKVYVNGFNGEVKIGDLGLATLLVKRYVSASQKEELKSVPIDIYAFGLCMLELITKVAVDRTLSRLDSWRLLRKVKDESARKMISQCLGPPDTRPSPAQLLQCDFFTKKSTFKDDGGGKHMPEPMEHEAGKLRGEDWSFRFEGYESEGTEGKLHIRLLMCREEDIPKDGDEEVVTKLNFAYHLEQDTPDRVAGELADSFHLSTTDREICAAALREWLAAITYQNGRDCSSDSN